MRYILILFGLFSFGCEKEETRAGTGNLLKSLIIDGKVWERFEYNSDNLLLKENRFYSCEQNPSDEFLYVYTSGKLDTIKSVMRSFLSNSTALCDPASGSRSYVKVEYDNQNRLSKSLYLNGTIRTFSYNMQNFIEKQTISFPAQDDLVISYKRDTAGNIVEESNSRGGIIQYEYDSKQNPYYLMKKQADIITASNNSPNNVVKITSGSNVQKMRYDYNRSGLPVKMYTSSGGIYEFMYQ